MALIRKKSSSRLASANQVNSLRSTGPRTSRGKTQSSINAVKHGIHSNVILAKLKAMGEGPAEHEKFHRALYLAFRPRDSFEQMLVEDMAVIRWRRLRLYSAEGEAWHRNRIDTVKKDAATLDSGEKLESGSGEFSGDEKVLRFAKEAYSWITQDPKEFGNLSEPSAHDAALLILSLALWQFRKEFAGFDEVGLQRLKMLYGTDPSVAGRTLLSRYESCLKQEAADGAQRKADEELFCENLDREVNYYVRLCYIIFDACAKEREQVTATFHGGTKRMRGPSDGHPQAALQRGEDEVMPGDVLDRIMRYESHLERQFERKLQQLVAWRRAKGEPPTPGGSNREQGTAQRHA